MRWLEPHTQDTYADFKEIASPATPSAGYVRVYPKSDSLMYQKDDTGLETLLGGGGSSGRWEPLANGIAADPQIIFADGDVVMIEVFD
jgi:hypothetical protein